MPSPPVIGLSYQPCTGRPSAAQADRPHPPRAGEGAACRERGDIRKNHAPDQVHSIVIAAAASRVTVQYTCPGNGYARTSIRRETPALVQLESQGIEGGLPFQFIAEARRTGSC